MQFKDVFREERYYCNHFFRLLCEGLSVTPESSGLALILESIGIQKQSATAIRSAEIYTEVAAFRDVFRARTDKDAFLEGLYDVLLPLLQNQYKGKITTPMRPSELSSRIGEIHPSKYRNEVKEESFGESDLWFYRELGALFNAKPDFLILLPRHAIWIEAKWSSAFSTGQIRRMRNIGALCATPLFADYFGGREPRAVLLGSGRHHIKAQNFDFTTFLSWERCAEIATSVFPARSEDITSRALSQLPEVMKES